MAFVHLPLASGFREKEIRETSRAFCAAIQKSAVERVVWTTSWLNSRAGTAVSPFFDALRDSADLALALRAAVTVFEPAGYLENFLIPASRTALSAGRLAYMLPPEFKYRWVSSAEQARWALAVLSRKQSHRGRLALGETLTGLQLAEAASDGLRSTVAYEFLRPEEFADAWRAKLGPAADLIANDYSIIARQPSQLGLEEDVTEAPLALGLGHLPAQEWFGHRREMFRV
jgi:hypothetical protein